MALEHRLRKIEDRLKPQPTSPIHEHVDFLVALPRETLVEAFGIVKDAGSYQYMFRPEEVALLGDEELSALNQLTPDEFYDLMMEQRSAPVIGVNPKETSNEHN